MSKKPLNKDDVIKNKKIAIKKINNLLESFINSPSGDKLKKANLLSYWLQDYAGFIDFENNFDPTKNISYKRGNIVKLNFGFNIGSEYGGLHYAIVLDNNNDHNSPVVTVIPLTSLKEDKAIHSNSVDLGNEIYCSLNSKYEKVRKQLCEERDSIKNITKTLSSLIITSETVIPSNTDVYKDINDAKSLLNDYNAKMQHNIAQQNYLVKIYDEISKMKQGSVALVNQITTISKIRIFDPRNIKGVLYGISLSEESMEKINKKMQELYIFNKSAD